MPSARRNTETGSLAGAASERVRAIIEAAEASAASIRAEAEAEADRIRQRAEERVTELRSEVRSDVQGLIASIRDGIDRLRSDLERLEARLGEAEPAAERAPAVSAAIEAKDNPSTGEADPGAAQAEEDPDTALAQDAAVSLDATPAADHEAARLVALNMALDGAPRKDVERHLREEHGVSEPGDLLDEVYESIGRS